MINEIIPLIIGFFLRSIALLAFLWIMIKIQKFDYAWLPLIASAFLASGLDMIPYFGHFIAVPVLYFCVWKITRSTIFPDAAFTVVLSYALMRCFSLFLLTAEFSGFHATSAMSQDDEVTNAAPIVAATPTNQAAQKNSKPMDKIAAKIEIKGISRGADGASVIIQYEEKNYIIPLGDAVSITTKEGLVTVNFLETAENSVTLGIHGQKVKYTVK